MTLSNTAVMTTGIGPKAALVTGVLLCSLLAVLRFHTQEVSLPHQPVTTGGTLPVSVPEATAAEPQPAVMVTPYSEDQATLSLDMASTAPPMATVRDALVYFLKGSQSLPGCGTRQVENAFLGTTPTLTTFVRAPWCRRLPNDVPEYQNNVGTFTCVANLTMPHYPLVSRGKKKTKMKLFDQGCGSKYPLSDARPGRNRTYMWTQDDAELRPQKSQVAVLLSGQFRRVSVAGPTQYDHLTRPNRAHTYVSTWPFPEDSIAPDASGGYVVPRLRNIFKESLAAVRVEMFGPRMIPSQRYGIANTAYMFFQMEAVARLAISNPSQNYVFFFRCRLDMVMEHHVVVSPSTSASAGRGNNTRDALLYDSNATGNDEPWQLDFGHGVRRVPAETIVVPSYTWCCMNDWFAVGRVTSMAPYSFMYSLIAINSTANAVDLVPLGGIARPIAAAAVKGKDAKSANAVKKDPTAVCESSAERLLNVSCARNPPEPLDLGFQRGQTCSAERCVAKLMVDARIPWVVADLPGTILTERRVDLSRSAPGCPTRCPTL